MTIDYTNKTVDITGICISMASQDYLSINLRLYIFSEEFLLVGKIMGSSVVCSSVFSPFQVCSGNVQQTQYRALRTNQ